MQLQAPFPGRLVGTHLFSYYARDDTNHRQRTEFSI
jgi:hypothetical protein